MIIDSRKFIEEKLLKFNIKIIHVKNFVYLEKNDINLSYSVTNFFGCDPEYVVNDIVAMFDEEEKFQMDEERLNQIKALVESFCGAIEKKQNDDSQEKYISIKERKNLIREKLMLNK